MAYKLLLTDAYSPLGMALTHVLEKETFTLMCPQPGELDWASPKAVDTYLQEHQPNIVINSLDWDDVFEKPQCTLIVNAAKSLAKACARLNICAIHLSSYQVFGGENKTAYDESDRPSPVDAQGKALRDAEKAFSRGLKHHIILRVSWLIGIQGDNLLSRLIALLSEGKEVIVDPNKRGAPTFMPDVGRVLVAMIKQVLCGAENWGVMHYTSGDACSEAEFARQLANQLAQRDQLRGRIEEVAVDEYSVSSAVLSGRRCRDNFGIQPHSWRQGLTAAVDMCLAADNTVSAD